jgi:hypothetical protein
VNDAVDWIDVLSLRPLSSVIAISRPRANTAQNMNTDVGLTSESYKSLDPDDLASSIVNHADLSHVQMRERTSAGVPVLVRYLCRYSLESQLDFIKPHSNIVFPANKDQFTFTSSNEGRIFIIHTTALMNVEHT